MFKIISSHNDHTKKIDIVPQLIFFLFYTETKPPEAITMTTTVPVTQSPTVEDTPSLMDQVPRLQLQYMCVLQYHRLTDPPRYTVPSVMLERMIKLLY